MTKTLLTRSRLIILSVVGIFFFSVAPVLPASQVYAQGKEEVCQGLGGCDSGAGLRVIFVVRQALRLFSMVIGIAGVVMIMLAGFRYITAGGDSSKIASAQNTIIWAAVGLVVAAMAQIIVRFVLTASS